MFRFDHHALGWCVGISLLSGCTSQPHGLPLLPAQREYVRVGTVRFKTLFSFDGKNGARPQGLVVSTGTLYGVTNSGGANDDGVAFRVTASNSEKVLHTFGSGTDGQHPLGDLSTLDGSLYGATSEGGLYSFGTIFSLSKSGEERWLYSFKGGADGLYPVGGFVNAQDELYGITSLGGLPCVHGSQGCG